MSENLLTAIIAASGSIIGALIGAVATIIVERMKENKNENRIREPKPPKNEVSVREPKPSINDVELKLPKAVKEGNRFSLVIIGAVIGGLLLLIPMVVFGYFPIKLPFHESYDNFNNSKFDGDIDKTLWTASVVSPSTIEQQKSTLVLTNAINNQPDPYLIATKVLKAGQYNYIQANMLLSSKYPGKDGTVEFAMFADNNSNGYIYFSCLIHRGVINQTWCEVYNSPSNTPEYSTQPILTDYDVWHTMRIEVDPKINITFNIDGKNIGNYQPPVSDVLFNSVFRVILQTSNPYRDGIQGLYDNVEIGQYR